MLRHRTRSRGLRAVVVISSFAVAGLLTAAVPPPPATEVAPEEPPIEGLPLHQQMVLVQSALSRVASDATRAERQPKVLADLEEIERRLIEATRARPPRFGALDEADQRRHDLAFRALLARTLARVAELERAVLELSLIHI